MTVSINFTIPDVQALITYIVLGIIVALLVGGLARMRSVLGYIVTIIMAALGGWLTVSIIKLQAAANGEQIFFGNVPIIEATIGALIFGLITVLIFRTRRVYA